MARLRVKGGLGPGPDGSSSDLEVGEGELFVLCGPSGTWSRPLLRGIAGLDPSPLEVLVDERAVHPLPPEDRGVGFVFPTGALFPHLTVGDNLGFSLRARGAPRFQIDERVTEAARITGLTPSLMKRPGALSRVELLRAAMARSLVRRPQLLLLDDPLGLSDPASLPALREELVAPQRRSGLTMVVSTTQPSDALAMASRLAVHTGGAVRQVGAPVQLFTAPADRFVAAVLGSPPMNLVLLDVTLGHAVFGGMSLAMPDLQQVVLGMSPDDVSFDAPTAPSLTFRGSYVRAEVEGQTALAAIDVNGERLRARRPSRHLPREGAQVTVSVDLGRLRLFCADALGRALPWIFPAPRPASVVEAEIEAARRVGSEVTAPATMSSSPSAIGPTATARAERTLVDEPENHADRASPGEATLPAGTGAANANGRRAPAGPHGLDEDTDPAQDPKSAVA